MWMKVMYRIGIDEVGRGPIAGPLVVCACAVRVGVDILSLFPKGVLKDSKKLSEKARDGINESVKALVENGDVIYTLGEIASRDIDSHGLSKAIKDAVKQALDGVHAKGVLKDSFIYLDGSLHAGDEFVHQETIIKGDEKVGEIALASIIAKVYRDGYMKDVAITFPDYGFESHVGYGTAMHYEAIRKHGMIDEHRRSFLTRFV
jgi:ribonuclease HII